MSNRKPYQYVDNHEEVLPEGVPAAMRQYLEDRDVADSTAYDNLYRIKQLYEKGFIPDGFEIDDPTIEEFQEIFERINSSDEDSKFSYRKALRAFYRDYRKSETSKTEQIKQLQNSETPMVKGNNVSDFGPHYQKIVWFSATKGTNGSRPVEPWMIMDPDEIRDIIGQVGAARERAFFWIGYSCAATSGEILQAKVHDIDLEDESIYIRGNKEHRSQRMELLNEALAAVRDYLRWHPGVDDPYQTEGLRGPDDQPIPLWVKKRQPTCKHCDRPQSHHHDDDKDIECGGYEAKPFEAIGRRIFYKKWREAVEASSVTRLVDKEDEVITEDDLKMKHMRKSMLTRFAAEIDEGVKEEQLRKFARWKPGGGSPEHYINLSEEVSRDQVKHSFKGEVRTDDAEPQMCAMCDTRNPPDRDRCQRCDRALDSVAAAEQENLKELASALAELDPDERAQAVQEVRARDETEQLKDRVNELEQQIKNDA